MIGKLEFVDLREIWKHEAFDFTAWLFENCDVLNDQLGLSLTPVEKEKAVGPFSVDILAEDINGPVIIENQLEKTDHDHMGKLLTYLSNLEAKTAIWISTDPRPEHVTTINYLNEVVPEDTKFFLLKLHAFRIGDSKPAPLFTIEAGPSIERTTVGKVKKELAESENKRLLFFQSLLAKSNEQTTLFSDVSPVGYQGWVNTGLGKSGVGVAYVINNKDARIDFFMNTSDGGLNQKRYEYLQTKKAEIENSYGEPLYWDFKEGRKQHYIRVIIKAGGLLDETKWNEIQNEMIEKLIRLEKSVRPYIKNLPQ